MIRKDIKTARPAAMEIFPVISSVFLFPEKFRSTIQRIQKSEAMAAKNGKFVQFISFIIYN
jgi:hypothetical protein